MAKKKNKRQSEAALRGWNTRRKNKKNEKHKKDTSTPKSSTQRKYKSNFISRKIKSSSKPSIQTNAKKTKTRTVKKHKSPKRRLSIRKPKHETKKSTQQKRVKKAAEKSSKKKSTNLQSKRKHNGFSDSGNRTGKRPAASAKKKKAKKSATAIRGRNNKIREKGLRKTSPTTKRNKPKRIIPKVSTDKRSNRTYFVTVRLASGERERKRPLNVIVWAKDGLKDQEVIELLWAMIKRRRDKNLMFALDMEVRELIVAHGPLTDRLQGYRVN